MKTPTAANSSSQRNNRYFYSISSLVLLLCTLIGFRFFYLQGNAFPNRPIAPPIRGIVFIHGALMTAWMLLSVVQPMLVATGRKRIHRALGRAGALLAIAIVGSGVQVAIGAARVNPPDLRLFGLAPPAFLTVPLFSISAFAIFVALGVIYRNRPEWHRPLLLMASLAAVSAAMGRMPELNHWYAGSWLEHYFSAFVTTLLLGAMVCAVKCLIFGRFDRQFAFVLSAYAVICLSSSLVARTDAWQHFAKAWID